VTIGSGGTITPVATNTCLPAQFGEAEGTEVRVVSRSFCELSTGRCAMSQ
jgi:hypothetical protein